MPQRRTRTDRRLRLGALTALVVVLSASPAHAYVDPGVMATLYQAGYVLVFGIITGLVVRPFRILRHSIERVKHYFKPAATHDN